MAHGHGRWFASELILVVDVGGGTTDVSLLENFDGIIEVRGYYYYLVLFYYYYYYLVLSSSGSHPTLCHGSLVVPSRVTF